MIYWFYTFTLHEYQQDKYLITKLHSLDGNTRLIILFLTMYHKSVELLVL